jgi:hypothetical protein
MRARPPTIQKAALRQEDGPQLKQHRTYRVLSLNTSIYGALINRIAALAHETIRRRQARFALASPRRVGRSFWPQAEGGL